MADIAIIGAGPVGLTLANLLGRRGLSVEIIEKQERPYNLPRAIHFDGEAMRVFQAAGLAEAVLPSTMIGRGMLFQNMAGEVLVDWSRDQVPGPNGWYESYRVHQPGLEQALADGLDRFPHIRLRRGVAATALEEDAAGVRLMLSNGERVAAHYVVGCDGAESFARRTIGGDLIDLGFEEPWLVVDLLLKRPRDDLGDYSIQFCDPEAPATYVRGVGDRRRWEMRVEPGADPANDHADIWRRLARWIGPDDAEIERAATYTFRSRIAETWSKGRVFLAGDAAHQMPPFMGQGMCAGIRDAANLAWKLTLACRGAPDLAPTYESERAHNLRQFIEMSVRLGRLINQTAAGEAPKGRLKSIWPALGEGFGPRDEVAGRIGPQAQAPDGRWSDDAADGGFSIIAAEPMTAPLPVFTGAADWLAERGLAAVLLRPDGYAYCGLRSGDELAGVLAAAPDILRQHDLVKHPAAA